VRRAFASAPRGRTVAGLRVPVTFDEWP